MILESFKNKLLTLGIPGLFLISFLDSAGREHYPSIAGALAAAVIR